MRQSVCRTGRWLVAFLIRNATLRKFMIIHCLTVGHDPFAQNDQGVERPLAARVNNSCRYWPRRFHEVSVAAQRFKQPVNCVHLQYLQAVTKLLK